MPEPSVLDWLQVATGVLGVLVAAVALVLTVRSARDARQSAAAATDSAQASRRLADLAARQLEVLTEQLEHDRRERARRPDLVVSLHAVTAELVDLGGTKVLLHVTLHNRGDHDAIGARFRLAVEGSDVRIQRCGDDQGRDPRAVSTLATTGVRGVAGPHVIFTNTEESVDLRAGVKETRTYRLTRPRGEWTLVTHLRHADDEHPPGRFTLRCGLDGPALVQAA